METYPEVNFAVNNLLKFQTDETFMCNFFYWKQRAKQEFPYYNGNGMKEFNFGSPSVLDAQYYESTISSKLQFYAIALENLKIDIETKIHNSNHNGFHNYFRFLKEYRVLCCEVKQSEILEKIEKRNKKNLVAFDEYVSYREKQFSESDNRKREHLKEYPIETNPLMPGRRLLNLSKQPPKTTYKNYCYDVIEVIPDLLDIQFLPDYLNFLHERCNEFKKVVDPYIERYESREILPSDQYSVKPTKKTTSPNDIKLFGFFEDISKYKKVMELLVAKGYCEPNTYIWKDEAKGNKSILVAIIKQLHKQGYYKDNRRPTNEEIANIVMNTFGIKIGIDTIKKATSDKFDVKFILPASTL